MKSNLSLRQLQCFVAVAEELHFRRAAERLHMSQPPLTQRIQTMERELGVQLFRRTGNKIELTEAGRLVLREARATLAQAERVKEVAERAERGETGHLRLGITIAALFFPAIRQAIRAFQLVYPGVTLDLMHVNSSPALEGLRQRKLDVCLIRSFSAPVPDAWVQTSVEHDRLMLVLPSDHVHADAKKIPLSALAGEKFLTFPSQQGHALYGQIANIWTQSGITPRVAQEAENGIVMIALVAAGVGNAILPSSLRAVHVDGVVWKTIDIDERWTSSSIVMVYRKETLDEIVPASFVSYFHGSASDCGFQEFSDEPVTEVIV
jgi:DNA-binding transcriptional LysR family regulator